MEKEENKDQNPEEEKKATTQQTDENRSEGSVRIDVKISSHGTSTRTTFDKDGRPVDTPTKNDYEGTYSIEITTEKVKRFFKVIGEAAGEVIGEKFEKKS